MKPNRIKNSLILENQNLEEIVTDIKDFKANQSWYQEKGIPWRRGYLFYGPPGSGKSAAAHVLASELEMDVYVLNLANVAVSDEGLIAMLTDMPNSGLLILEEIDTIFKGRNAAGGRKASAAGVSFSGLLNALDGLTAKEGRIVIMTTNHIEHLDPALIRPGRVDKQIYFGYASKSQAERMFLRFFEGQEKLAQMFADAIPEDLVSMASLQEHMIKHRESADNALGTYNELIETAIKLRQQAEESEKALAKEEEKEKVAT